MVPQIPALRLWKTRLAWIIFFVGLVAMTSRSAEAAKKIIEWGAATDTPTRVQMGVNSGLYEQVPFDGLVIQSFPAYRPWQVAFDWEAFGNYAFRRSDISATITTLDNINFQRFTDNFLRINVSTNSGTGPDWFDDFTPVLNNVGLWAGVANETGYKGFMFDVEDYGVNSGRGMFKYSDLKYKTTKTFDQYAAQVRLRGSQVMQAIQQTYPDITLFLTLAHSYVYRWDPTGQYLSQIEYGLLPAFVDGLIEAAGPGVKIIDGQEQAYGYTKPADYDNGLDIIKNKALSLVAPELRTKYSNVVQAGVALYMNYIINIKPTLKTRLHLLESNVYNALRTADEYAWMYSEQMSWYEAGYPIPTPPGSVEAIRSAKIHIKPFSIVPLQDNFTGSAGTAVDSSKWTASSQAAVHLDGNGKVKLDADAGISRLYGLGDGGGSYGLKPDDKSACRLTVTGLNDTAGGWLNFGLAVDANQAPSIMMRKDNPPSGSGWKWYLQVWNSDYSSVAKYATDVSSASSIGDWVIDWSNDRVLVWYNNEVKVDTKIDTPDYIAGTGLVLPTVNLVPYFEKWGGNYATIDAVTWGRVLLSFLLGDANGDYLVSADDYASVQANFGNSGAPGILGDANYDGVVSADDYASVQANFGNHLPEPATLVLLSIGSLSTMLVRQHRRRS